MASARLSRTPGSGAEFASRLSILFVSGVPGNAEQCVEPAYVTDLHLDQVLATIVGGTGDYRWPRFPTGRSSVSTRVTGDEHER